MGTILRRTAGGIAALVGLLLVLPILVGFLPSPWSDDINKFLPGVAGTAIFQVVRTAWNPLRRRSHGHLTMAKTTRTTPIAVSRVVSWAPTV